MIGENEEDKVVTQTGDLVETSEGDIVKNTYSPSEAPEPIAASEEPELNAGPETDDQEEPDQVGKQMYLQDLMQSLVDVEAEGLSDASQTLLQKMKGYALKIIEELA